MYKINTILQGDTLSTLKTLPDEFVDTIITSPPYYGLRDYGTAKWEGGDSDCQHFRDEKSKNANTGQRNVEGGIGDGIYREICGKCGAKRIDQQLGLEKTLDLYLNKMLLITGELKRVLKKTGVMFWNHGDSYASEGSLETGFWHGDNPGKNRLSNDEYSGRSRVARGSYPAKSLLLQNYRLVIKMIDDQDWILRNSLIWWKPNCMPSSVKDRFTVDYEPVFFFSKSKKYWFEMQYEAFETTTDMAKRETMRVGLTHKAAVRDWQGGMNERGKDAVMQIHLDRGRNKRCVWKIPTQSFKEAHFATFPEKLIEPMIKAGCPEFICKKCGKAREKIMVTERPPDYNPSSQDPRNKGRGEMSHHRPLKEIFDVALRSKRIDKGYSDCGCNAGFDGGIVLDPFMGSGTTGVVAKKLGRRWIGIELNQSYIDMVNKRISEIPEKLF